MAGTRVSNASPFNKKWLAPKFLKLRYFCEVVAPPAAPLPFQFKVDKGGSNRIKVDKAKVTL